MGSPQGQGRVPRWPFLMSFVVLFRHNPRAAPALLGGTLPLRYCAAGFASKVPREVCLQFGALRLLKFSPKRCPCLLVTFLLKTSRGLLIVLTTPRKSQGGEESDASVLA